jgi:hypothetical protein
MDKNLIKTVIGEKLHEISNVKFVRRPVLYEDATSYVNVGIRRAGKSWLPCNYAGRTGARKRRGSFIINAGA